MSQAKFINSHISRIGTTLLRKANPSPGPPGASLF
jgi:hypothetical protein